MNEEANVEELEYTPNMDEQSAAWREVARDAVRRNRRLGLGLPVLSDYETVD